MLNKHLKDNDISYFSHMKRSLCLSGMALTAGAIFLIHSFLPFLFEKEGSRIIKRLNKKI